MPPPPNHGRGGEDLDHFWPKNGHFETPVWGGGGGRLKLPYRAAKAFDLSQKLFWVLKALPLIDRFTSPRWTRVAQRGGSTVGPS